MCNLVVRSEGIYKMNPEYIRAVQSIFTVRDLHDLIKTICKLKGIPIRFKLKPIGYETYTNEPIYSMHCGYLGESEFGDVFIFDETGRDDFKINKEFKFDLIKCAKVESISIDIGSDEWVIQYYNLQGCQGIKIYKRG